MLSLRDTVLSAALDRYGTEAEYPFTNGLDTAVLRHPNGKWYGVIMGPARSSLGLPGEGTVDLLNVKCDPVLSGSLRLQPGFLPAYHMNKESWLSIQLDGSVPLSQIRILLEISYDLVGRRSPRGKRPRP